MRAEEKEVDGRDLEQAEERKRETELVEEDDHEIRDLDGQPYEMEKDRERSGDVLGAMRKILEGEHIVINDLKLPQRELKALEALNTAKRGKSGDLDRFVYAEDRRTLLEQALAVLQPDIVSVQAIGEPFEELLKEVSELRSQLNTLQDSEEEVVHRPEVAKTTETDTDDKDDDEDTSLDGPERKVAKPTSSLADGKEVKPIEKPKSSLADGKEVAPAAKGPTSLGDPKEIASAEKALPFWRKPSNG